MTTRPIRVFNANVCNAQVDQQRRWREFLELPGLLGHDVFALQEAPGYMAVALHEQGLNTCYSPYPDGSKTGLVMAVRSGRPFVNAYLSQDRRALIQEANFNGVRIFNAHIPLMGGRALRRLAQYVCKGDGVPAVVAGDFNRLPSMPGRVYLADVGMRSMLQGEATFPTQWGLDNLGDVVTPLQRMALSALLRVRGGGLSIDDVFYSGGLELVPHTLHLHDTKTSDHRYISAEIKTTG